MFWNHFRLVVPVLLIGNILSTIVVYRFAGGDSGWWPVYLLLNALISVLYSAIFSAFGAWKNISVFPAGHVHIGLAIVSVGLTVALYKGDVDWLAISKGADLSRFQQFIHSDLKIYVVHLVALVIAVFTGMFGVRK